MKQKPRLIYEDSRASILMLAEDITTIDVCMNVHRYTDETFFTYTCKVSFRQSRLMQDTSIILYFRSKQAVQEFQDWAVEAIERGGNKDYSFDDTKKQ